MDWTGKVRSALKGEVAADDVAAGLAASRPLDDLRQRLDDRRLEQNLAYPRLPWVPVDALGPLATPLWLADVVVALVGRVYDAHQPSGSGVRATVRMNQGAHDHLMALLGLVPPLLQEVSIALTDPTYAPAVRLPMGIGLRDAVPGNLGFLPVDASYLRGLLAGALYLQHAVDVAMEATRGVVGAAGAPEWMRQVVGQVGKRVAAHAITVESLQARCAPLLARRAFSDDTIFDTTVACWSTISSYVDWGQLLVYPRLGLSAASISVSPPPSALAPPAMAQPSGSPPSATRARPPAPPTSTPQPSHRPTVSRSRPTSSGPTISPGPSPVPSARPPDAPHTTSARPPDAPHTTSPPAPATTNTPPNAHQPARATPTPPPPPSPAPRPRQAAHSIRPTERWLLTRPEVRQRLRHDGREEIAATGLDSFWTARRWTVFQDEQDYLEAVTHLQEQGLIEQTDSFRGIAPFASVYRVVAGKPTIDGIPLRLGQTFTYDHDQGRLLPR